MYTVLFLFFGPVLWQAMFYSSGSIKCWSSQNVCFCQFRNKSIKYLQCFPLSQNEFLVPLLAVTLDNFHCRVVFIDF